MSFSDFLQLIFIAINFCFRPLRTAFAVSHRFWNVVFLSSFVWVISFFPLYVSFTYFFVLVCIFSIFHPVIDFKSYTVVVGNILDLISVFLNLLTFFCGLPCDLCWRIFHVHLKYKCILAFLDGMSCRYLSPASNATVCLLIFYLDILCIDVNGVLKSHKVFF